MREMNPVARPPAEPKPVRPPNPLREYGYGPVFLLVYVMGLTTLQFLLAGLGKKSAVSC
jgi:hypothetical protein